MLKIDKTTHLAILFTFALSFVVIYLYYAISDVRKVQLEVKQVQEDVASLQKLVTSLNKVKPETVNVPPPVHVDIKTVAEQPSAPAPVCTTATSGDNGSCPAAAPIADDVSVTTDEVRTILDVESDEEADIVPSTPPPEPPKAEAPKETKDVAATLASMSYDELREVCKKNNLSTKGTRQVLLARLQEFASQ